MSELEAIDLPAAVLEVLGPNLADDAQRIWRRYARAEYRETLATAPNPQRATVAVAHFVAHVLRSELTMWENVASGMQEIVGKAEAQIEANNTHIADLQSDHDQAIAALDRQIEDVRRQQREAEGGDTPA